MINKTSKGKGRKVRKSKENLKQYEVVDRLRESIVSGEYQPGDRIPIQIELVKKFRMSSVTIQQAVDALKAQGFLTAKRRMGTFVVAEPPHLVNYALVFPHTPNHSPIWSHFYETLKHEAVTLSKELDRSIECFFGMEDFERSPDYVRLVKLVKEQRLAGLIFAAPPQLLMESPLMTEPMPRAAIASVDKVHLGVPLISANSSKVIEMAVDCLLLRNRKRIALLSTTPAHVDEWLRRQYEFANRGVITNEHWCFALSARLANTAKSCVRLLMELSPDQQPDGIIVMDDHLLEPVEQGLLQSLGETAAEAVDIVGLCNLPDRFGHLLPVEKIGFMANDLLRKGVWLIDEQRKGHKVPKVTMVDPIPASSVPEEAAWSVSG